MEQQSLVGTRIILKGLEPDLNGRSGVVKSSVKDGKIMIRLDGGGSDKEIEIDIGNTISIQERIREIQRSAEYTGSEKAKAIQALMQQPSSHQTTPPESAVEATSVAHVPECEHYQCECVIIAFCCKRPFGCRVCHDEHIADHKIDRFATAEVICKQCDLRQPVTNQCTSCGVQFGEYFCSICKLWKADGKGGTFHCEGCGICRLGKRSEFVHCENCSICLPKTGIEDHICLEGKYKGDCPICRQDLFSSRVGVSTMPCGHPIHGACLDQLAKSDAFPRCPLCMKCICDMSRVWEDIQNSIDAQPMPKDMKGAPGSVTVRGNVTKTELTEDVLFTTTFVTFKLPAGVLQRLHRNYKGRPISLFGRSLRALRKLQHHL